MKVPDTRLSPGKQQDLGATFYPSQNSHSSKFFTKGLGQQDCATEADVLRGVYGKSGLRCMPGLLSEAAGMVKLLPSPAFAIFNRRSFMKESQL